MIDKPVDMFRLCVCRCVRGCRKREILKKKEKKKENLQLCECYGIVLLIDMYDYLTATRTRQLHPSPQ